MDGRPDQVAVCKGHGPIAVAFHLPGGAIVHPGRSKFADRIVEKSGPAIPKDLPHWDAHQQLYRRGVASDRARLARPHARWSPHFGFEMTMSLLK